MKATSFQIRKKSLIIHFFLIVQISFSFLYSQQSQQVAINPVMKVSNLRESVESPIRLEKLNVDIKIVGKIAITTLEMTYYNPNLRVMEGEFNFPLGDGQTVSRFALDINGVLREGVIVEKAKGRATFEAIVRRGIDPGLLEKTEGNNFRMRIYPLPAKGTRKIVLALEQELTEKGTYDLYTLPLRIHESIAKFSVHAEVIKNTVKLDTANNELNNLLFNKWNDSYVANLEQSNYVPDKQIALAFAHSTLGEQVFTAAKNKYSDSSYFYVNIRPTHVEQIKELPKHITLLWDNSNSRNERNIQKELVLLGNYIKRIGNLTIQLVPFNIKTEKTETFEIINGTWDKLEIALKNMVYDGGTSFGCLDFSKFASDEILLFSDGLTSFGHSEPKFSHTPVYTFNSNSVANTSFLRYISQLSGGVFFDLNTQSPNDILVKLTNSNYHFISAQIKDGQVSHIYPSAPCQFNNTFSLVGKIKGDSATLILNFGYGSTITYSKTISITTNQPIEPSILSRIWAEKKIAELSLNEAKNKEEITQIGKQFGIVTSNTSLIVLESINDYVDNAIVPPSDMMEEYFKIKSLRDKNTSEKTMARIEYVVNLSNEQSKWWNRTFVNTPAKTISKKIRNSVRFTPPVIRTDADVNADELKSQEMVNDSKGIVSISTVVGGDDELGADIADVRVATTEVSASTVTTGNVHSTIELNAWDPQTPYLKVLQYATVGTEYPTYLKLKKEYGSTPSFYIDVADYFSKLGKKDTAVAILSNLAELKLESPQLLRSLGNKLLDFKRYDEAVLVFEKVLKLKNEEPQSYRDLGLAYEASGNYQQAINTLYEVLKSDWDGRFLGIELIVLNEINNIIAMHPSLDYRFIDKRLIKKEPVNIRVCLTWDTDNCDMDLWVTDPNGEKCFYQNQLTNIGGKISTDFTEGYGPEEFMIKKAITGKYLIQANYYGTLSQKLLAPVNLHLVFITNYGKPNQKKQELTIRLENKEDVINVGKFSFTNN